MCSPRTCPGRDTWRPSDYLCRVEKKRRLWAPSLPEDVDANQEQGGGDDNCGDDWKRDAAVHLGVCGGEEVIG